MQVLAGCIVSMDIPLGLVTNIAMPRPLPVGTIASMEPLFRTGIYDALHIDGLVDTATATELAGAFPTIGKLVVGKSLTVVTKGARKVILQMKQQNSNFVLDIGRSV